MTISKNQLPLQYFLNGRVCVYMYHTIAINFLRSSSHSNKLHDCTQKNTCQNFLTQKNHQTMNFKPKKIVFTSLSLEIWRTPSPGVGGI